MRSVTHRHVVPRAWHVIAGLLLFGSALPVAIAGDICVSSDPDLVNALVAAKTAAQNIQIVQGTYHLDSTAWTTANYSPRPGTTIGGGYTTNCAGRNIGPGNTVLLATQQVSTKLLGNLTLEGLTFGLGQGLFVSADDANHPDPGLQLVLRRDVFRQSGATAYGSMLRINWNIADSDASSGAKIVNSLFHDDTAATDYGIIEMSVYAGSPELSLTNNTVYGNIGVGVRLLNNGGDGGLQAHDNIVFNNSLDLYTSTNKVELVRNTYGTRTGPTPDTETGTQNGNPQLNASTYRPIETPTASPVINTGEFAGSAGLPSTDLDGGARVVGSRVDRGAYESSIVDSFVLTVTNTNDSGSGSLRAAISSANANGSGLIGFNIPGGCSPARVIALASPLPAITSAVLISGYSQPGSSPNTLDVGVDAYLCVVLDGSAIPDAANANGLLVDSSAPSTTQLTVMGLGFSGFDNAAINFSGGSGHSVLGSHIGGNVSGVNMSACGWGVFVGPGGGSVTIGGDDAADRNIIGNATLDGIRLFTNGNTVANNYLGVGWNNSISSYVDRGNGRNGITVSGADNLVHDNLVGYNAVNGIVVNNNTATGNVVEHNSIGRAFTYTGALANGGAGVSVDFGAHDNTFRYNTIGYNNSTGVRLVSGLGNTARFNAIGYNNGALGIDIAGAGVTANDDDNAAGALNLGNRGLNFPVLSLATNTVGLSGTVQGTLASTIGDYFIDVYASGTCDTTGHGPGSYWLASQKVSIGISQPSVSFTIPVPWWSGAGVITTTATDASGNSSPGNTSEFSTCKSVIEERLFANGFDPPPI